ncbi:transposase [Salinispora arenicola]|uniref:transposase n=1 Tax=Salinispora arenicola TaxID=168697 RepID=UPI003466574F
MLDELAEWGMRPPLLTADAGYGQVAEFRQGLTERGIPYEADHVVDHRATRPRPTRAGALRRGRPTPHTALPPAGPQTETPRPRPRRRRHDAGALARPATHTQPRPGPARR